MDPFVLIAFGTAFVSLVLYGILFLVPKEHDGLRFGIRFVAGGVMVISLTILGISAFESTAPKSHVVFGIGALLGLAVGASVLSSGFKSVSFLEIALGAILVFEGGFLLYEARLALIVQDPTPEIQPFQGESGYFEDQDTPIVYADFALQDEDNCCDETSANLGWVVVLLFILLFAQAFIFRPPNTGGKH